jgi:hypothetical protein|tara:strand:- start:336 stop:1058 length:723 start_codon:yes stop_codon:yes gene_type:complete
MKYDLIIPAHPKDYVKLQFCLGSCLEYLNPSPENVYIITPDGISGQGLISIKDDHAIPIKQSDINYRRPNWIFQQFVNLFQDFTENDMYLSVDADIIFNRQIDLFESDKPTFFISDRDQHHVPYFIFMDKWRGLSRQVDYTFINDFMMFDKNICREMVPDIHDLLDFCNEVLSEDCLLAEFEIYGNYVTKYHADRYNTKPSKTSMSGKVVQDPWTVEQIQHLILAHQGKDFDLFSLHSWT